jgi:hypothetical protein
VVPPEWPRAVDDQLGAAVGEDGLGRHPGAGPGERPEGPDPGPEARVRRPLGVSHGSILARLDPRAAVP